MPLDITEYQRLASDARGITIPTGQEPSRAVQQVEITGVSEASEPVSDVTRFVRIHADTTCRIAFGPNPVASPASQRLPGGATEFYGIDPGTKIAVIASA